MTNEKGIWFFSGVISLLLGKLLTSPFFTKPADSLSYASLAFFALIFVDRSGLQTVQISIYWTLITYYWIVILIGSASILLKDSLNNNRDKWGKTFFQVSELLGNQNAIFSSVAVFAIWVFHISPQEQFYPTLGWAITAIQPHSFISESVRKIRNIWNIKLYQKSIGKISSHQTPGLLTISQDQDVKIQFGQILAIKDKFISSGLAIALHYVGRSEGLYFKALLIPNVEGLKFSKWKALFNLPYYSAAQLPFDPEMDEAVSEVEELYQVKNLIGIVLPDSSIQKIYFEVIQELEIEVGQLVRVQVGDNKVLYQLINGLTKEDIIAQKDKNGYAKGEARVIGIWQRDNKFTGSKWIPRPNGLVYLEQSTESENSVDRIGHFPKSKYNININDINSLVTHNTAILGILGIGKSMLAIELVDRIVNAGIKVICIDLTNQYQKELNRYIDEGASKKFFQKIKEVGEKGKTSVSKNVEEGGSKEDFKELTKDFLNHFILNQSKLFVINPSEFEVWRQDSKPYNNEASMVSLTPSEITSIISEATLEILQTHGMSDKAKVCLIYEEAHSLVPEWNSVVNEGDKAATNATAWAILQGRKYGMGCILITQRTANVTKTILNQCNTIFAMRIFDDTGISFLSNYIGSEYSQVLPNLSPREAILFGKASSCENPVLIRLNNREDFTSVFYKDGKGNGKKITA